MESVLDEKRSEFATEAESRRIEAVIINPFRAAAVAGEVGGRVDEFYFELGDLVHHGQVVAEISAKRFRLVVKRAKENVRALRVALDRARKDKEIKARLFAMDVSSEQELGRAESEAEVAEHKVKEAETALEQAELDVEACQVRAPFTGYLAARHKEPHEAVAPLDKLFTLVDNAKVFAVAYVPETFMGNFSKGKEAVFVEASGRQFRGRVERVEPIIDPKTDTRKVFVLIDNAQHPLEIGMSGSLESLQ
ncbi:MAG: efflux RND transporter periplasmic adaptor subunit [Desulfomonile tiedjei]|nr:efflux RND transporter periplasmic adaptor subunit [Desulfomonile tiedjei]